MKRIFFTMLDGSQEDIVCTEEESNTIIDLVMNKKENLMSNLFLIEADNVKSYTVEDVVYADYPQLYDED